MRRMMVMLGLALSPAAAHAQVTPQPDYVSWRDPVEGAFTIDVPRGWMVVGGLMRKPGDPRQVVEMRSPDGTVEIGIGDQGLPFFMLPTPLNTSYGLRPGMRIDAATVLLDYETGEAFAQDYGSVVFGRACGQPVAMTGHKSFGARQGVMAGVPQSSAAGGAVTFRCDAPAHPFTAMTIGLTELLPFTGIQGGTWTVPLIVRVAETTGETPATAAIVSHVMGSWHTDPSWQSREDAARLPTPSPSVDSGHESVSDYRRRILGDAAAARSAASHEGAANVSAYVNDNVRLTDPTTGAGTLAPAGSDVYVKGADGRITGHAAGETLDGSGTVLQPVR